MHPGRLSIHRLDPKVAARIAAGEVIERPASVVKELLENALDAGATLIRVELESGGMDRLRVVDNGCGIHPAELDLAFERHATSKLTTVADLEAIATLGFRGEALPSIAAVSSLRIETRTAPCAAGAVLLLEGGAVVEKRSAGLPEGTSVEVTNLFATLPARRKFLKGRQSEGAAAQAVVAHYAMANPGTAISLLADGQPVLSTAGATNLSDVLTCLYGVETASHLLTLDGERHGVGVGGLVSQVGHTRATRGQQSFFVNGRWVRNRVLSIALEEGYHSMLMSGRHPVAVVLLQVPADEIDVNVHPAKAEVRFLREREVFSALRHVVNVAVSPRPSAAVMPSTASAGDAGFEQQSLLEPGPEGGTAHDQSVQGEEVPALRVLGQAGALFIIAEGPDGVYMVDQHAAHERVLYDELAGQLACRAVPVQALLEPLLVDLSSAEVDALTDCAQTVLDFGFQAEPFGESTCLLRAVPALLPPGAAAEALQALLDDLGAGKAQGDRQERLLAIMACKAAVKAGQTLSLEEMRFLVRRLEGTTRPKTCPHGRPTMLRLSTSALERQFGRR